jgi:hypothetical protein
MLISDSSARIRCSMVIYELERELARFVKEHDSTVQESGVSREIASRTANEGKVVIETSQLLENSYLAEVVALAQHVCRGTSLADWCDRLANLIVDLEVYEIRNSISHPNRAFPDYYWYRCAAIATDPAVDGLGLHSVVIAFENAIEGRIQDPPEDWLKQTRWAIPTNLPSEFEHAVTGLYGRAKDSARLMRELSNARVNLVSVVARGGVGKTSLVLQVLSDFCLSAAVHKLYDGVVWISLKQERLTDSGIEYLSAPSSIGELTSQLCHTINDLIGTDFGSLEELTIKKSETRLLICIDNLETIIRDDPELFDNLQNSFPARWRILVTSRVLVDGAKNLPLDALDHSGAIALSRAYLSSKGHASSDASILQKIVDGCRRNPLAIRLAIDAYLAGKELPEALQRSEEQVLAYSFKNLLDALGDEENSALEALFALNEAGRSQICDALDMSVDSAATALSRLVSMSLVTRSESDTGDRYALGDSIRDLLRAHPSRINVRTKVANWAARSRDTEQAAIRQQTYRNLPEVALDFLPTGTSALYIELNKKCSNAAKTGNRQQLIELEVRVRHLLADDSKSSLLHRLYGRLMLDLQDPVQAVNSFELAANLNTADSAPILGLSYAHAAQNRWEEVRKYSFLLVERGWGDPKTSGSALAGRIWGLLMRALLFTEDLEQVFILTQDCEQKIEDLPILAVSRASAYRRKVAEEAGAALDEARLGELFGKAASLLTAVLRMHGVQRWLTGELSKCLGEYLHQAHRGMKTQSFRERDRLSSLALLEACERHSTQMTLESVMPLVNEVWEYFGKQKKNADTAVDRASVYRSQGYTIAMVKPGGKSGANYFFAKCDEGRDYYVQLGVFEGGAASFRTFVQPGKVVALKFDPKTDRSAHRALEAWLV